MRKSIKQEQWVLLPTEKESHIHQFPWEHNQLEYQKVPKTFVRGESEALHLYLTVKGKIQKGEAYVDLIDMKAYILMIDSCELSNRRKILATSNNSLLNSPNIPESFIRHYVEKQGKVGDVELEYREDLKGSVWSSYVIQQCKLTEQNEIIIHIPPPIHVGGGETFMDRADKVLTVHNASIRNGVYQDLADHLGFKETHVNNQWSDDVGGLYTLTKLGFNKI